MANTKITADVIEANAVLTANITDANITSAKLADLAVTEGKIANTAITAGKIATDAVITAKIQNDAVTTVKIPNNAVTSAKLDTNIDIAGTFDVTGAATLDSTVTVAGTGTFTGLVDAAIIDGANFKINGAQGSDGQVLTSTGSGVAWEAVAGGVAGIVSNADATAITITSSENVGIGETNSANLLHVKASDTGIAPHTSAQIVLEREGTNYLQFLTAETGTEKDQLDLPQATIKT
mgnify:CR=1 FL=1